MSKAQALAQAQAAITISANFDTPIAQVSNRVLELDPRDADTCWQTIQGPDPSLPSGDGDRIGVMLDKSQWGGKTFDEVMAAQTEILPEGDFSQEDLGRFQLERGAVTNFDNGVLEITNGEANFALLRAYEVEAGIVGAEMFYVVIEAEDSDSGTQAVINLISFADVTWLPISAGFTGAGVYAFLGRVRTDNPPSHVDILLGVFTDTPGDSVRIKSVSIKTIPGNHAYQETVADRPLRTLSGGRWSIQMDGVNEYLRVTYVADIDIGGNDWQAFSAFKNDNAAFETMLGWGSNTSADNWRLFCASGFYPAVYTEADVGNNRQFTGTGLSGEISVPMVMGWEQDAGTHLKGYINGFSQTLGTLTLPTGSTRDLTIGADLGTYFFVGHIYGVVLFNNGLMSDADALGVQKQLAIWSDVRPL